MWKIKGHCGVLLAAILFFFHLFSSLDAANLHYFVIKNKKTLSKDVTISITCSENS